MRIVPVPCLSDNYAYLVAASGSKRCFVIDPSEAAPVAEAVKREGLELVAIVNTHHHHDHVGGNEELGGGKALPVFAHESDDGRIPGLTDRVREGVPIQVAGLELVPLHVPGHTTGAVAYHTGDAVFTGDTLFIAGCGRLFEGTPAMMHTSLVKKLGALPGATRVFCGHEYTVSNLKFAAFAEPDNEAVKAKLDRATAMRARGEVTVGSTMAEELATNPFLRVGEASIRAKFGGADDVETLAHVRKAKDTFKA